MDPNTRFFMSAALLTASCATSTITSPALSRFSAASEEASTPVITSSSDGVSWGCTLALAYAQTYPDRVDALVLGFVTTTSRREVQWITEDMGRVFPEQWERFIDAIPSQLRHLRPVEAYVRMLADPDAGVRDRAALEWCAWEDTHVSFSPGHTPNPRYHDPAFRLRFARLVTHYWQHSAFLEEDQLIEFCGSRLARYKCPTKITFVEEIPHGLGGKLLRRALR